MRELIINADDFGLHPSINRGIIRAYREGILSSTTLMCSAPAFADAVALASKESGLGVGIHLTLVGGVRPLLPATEVPTLVDEQGLFPVDYIAFVKRFYTGRVKRSEVYRELKAQIERGLATGLSITHLDSHQHMHVLPGITPIVVDLARELGIKAARIPEESMGKDFGFAAGLGRKIGRNGLSFCAALARRAFTSAGIKVPAHFYGMLGGGNLSVPMVREFLLDTTEGVSEIMTHPGDDAALLGGIFPWHYHWEQERDIYLDKAIKNLVEQQKISIVNFARLVRD